MITQKLSTENDTTFLAYQKLADSTSGAHDSLDRNEARLAIAGLGLAGEAGEVADEIKKVIGHGHKLDEDKLIKEIGDVLWYAAEMCSALGVSLDYVAKKNIEKLKARYPEGFSRERSINRVR